MELLTKLAKAFDTKGYPDDKDPNHWRTINHAPVHVDANGNVDGGASQKFNGAKWTSQKHPHNPNSYPKPAAPKPAAPTPPPAPQTTVADLKTAWAKVRKYRVAMNQSRTQKTYQANQQKAQKALNDFIAMYTKAPLSVSKQFKPNTVTAGAHIKQSWQAPAAKQPAPPAQPAVQPAQPTTPLQSLAQNTTPPQTQQPTNNLQPAAGNGTVTKGRNVKIYNMSKRNERQRLNGLAMQLNMPTSIRSSSTDINVLAKAIAAELKNRNKNYGSYTVSQTKAMNTKALKQKLTSIPYDKLNPTIENDPVQNLGMALGWNEPPRVMNKADFNNYMKAHPKAVEMFRGVGPGGGLSVTDVVDDLKYGDVTWRGGSCKCWGTGIYFAAKRSYAAGYATGNGKVNGVIRGVIDETKANTIDWDAAEKLTRKAGLDPYNEINVTFVAMQHGYNCVYVKNGNSHSSTGPANSSSCGDFYVVLDRSIMIVQKEDG